MRRMILPFAAMVATLVLDSRAALAALVEGDNADNNLAGASPQATQFARFS